MPYTPEQNRTRKGLSAAVLALVAAGATSYQIAEQFLSEKEGANVLKAYRDGSAARIWTICTGQTAGVTSGMTKTKEECEDWFKSDVGQAFVQFKALVKPEVFERISPPSLAGMVSFCTYNLGPYKCAALRTGEPTTFIRKLNAGDIVGACHQIPTWIFDGGKDCRIRSNNCYGQVERRDQEEALCLM